MSKSTKKPRANLNLESLEDRLAPANWASGGYLHIQGNSLNNMAVVSYAAGKYHVNEEGTFWDRSYWPGQVYKGIIYHGGAGNDLFVNNTWLRSWAFGEGGDDTLIGGWNRDWLFGQGGKDYLNGRGGNDYLSGGVYGIVDTLVNNPGDGFDTFTDEGVTWYG